MKNIFIHKQLNQLFCANVNDTRVCLIKAGCFIVTLNHSSGANSALWTGGRLNKLAILNDRKSGSGFKALRLKMGVCNYSCCRWAVLSIGYPLFPACGRRKWQWCLPPSPPPPSHYNITAEPCFLITTPGSFVDGAIISESAGREIKHEDEDDDEDDGSEHVCK